VANLYTPYTWVDGELVTATQGANRWEQGIDALDGALDTQTARIDALQAAISGLSLNTMPSGPTSLRPQPAVGRMYFDTTIGKPIIGNGTAWLEFGAGGVVEGPGSSTAPTGFTTTVNPDNSILCSWNAVAGATHYKLYEVRSPNGVSGADTLTTTSSLRTPSSMGYYEYWCTAFVGGVESAQSNHGICSLPFGSDPENPGDPGGDPAGSPAELLAIGAGGGSWNLGVGYPSGHVDISPSQLESGWSEAPYFYINDAGTHVVFRTPMNGGRTSSNTKYPRTELREYINGSKASWNGGSGTHLMSGRTRILHMEDDKPEYVFAQMHDGSDDTLQLRWENGTLRASINGETHSTTMGNFPIGTEFAWEIRVSSGTLTIKINGSTKITSDPDFGSGNYFKTGSYPNQNSRDQDNPDNGYAALEMRDLVVSHS